MEFLTISCRANAMLSLCFFRVPPPPPPKGRRTGTSSSAPWLFFGGALLCAFCRTMPIAGMWQGLWPGRSGFLARCTTHPMPTD
jgi:hypothetical protein